MRSDIDRHGDVHAARAAQLERACIASGFPHVINGKRSLRGEHLEVFDPSTGKALCTVPSADREVLDSAVNAARGALDPWCATSFDKRRTILNAVFERIDEHIVELSALLTAEQGRPMTGSKWEIEYLTHLYGKAFQKFEMMDQEGTLDGFGPYVKRFTPLGVVCVISPWNLPVALSYMAALPALLTGNTVVLKVSPFSPLTSLRIADYINDLLPPGVLNVITGNDELGPMMTAHPGVNQITFTGSTVTGRRVLESSAASLKRVSLELGGNDAGIVLPDADPADIAESLFWHMFMLNGQACIGLKRLFVHEDLYLPLTSALVTYAQRVKTGDGFDLGTNLGPVQNQTHYKRLMSTLRDIENSGATILYKGHIPEDSGGYFVPITMIDNPPDEATFVKEELFGPIRSIFKYTNLDDAIDRANSTEYGLGASVWGKDFKVLNKVARRLQAGTVWINQHATLHPLLPFSGHKGSGIGAQLGVEGLHEFCNVQVVARSEANQ